MAPTSIAPKLAVITSPNYKWKTSVMPRKELIDIAGEISAETTAAYRFFDGSRHVWLPKSQCQWDADAKEMTMPEWLAKEKELI
jgi:hypothetical protein